MEILGLGIGWLEVDQQDSVDIVGMGRVHKAVEVGWVVGHTVRQTTDPLGHFVHPLLEHEHGVARDTRHAEGDVLVQGCMDMHHVLGISGSHPPYVLEAESTTFPIEGLGGLEGDGTQTAYQVLVEELHIVLVGADVVMDETEVGTFLVLGVAFGADEGLVGTEKQMDAVCIPDKCEP
jgi:hypothetical protein